MTVYYVKLRPHVHEFLQEARKMYELHIYTMGTRTYADAVAQALDPDGTIFAGRVLSRDESGSFMHKSLARLFPYEQSMVVVVDDRADVWQWPPNLLRVRPYDFFVGIGDINAHVYEAAKRGEIPVSDVPKAKLAPSPSGSDKDIKPAKDLRQAKLQEEAVAEEAAEDYDTENGEEPPDEDLNEKVLAELDRAQKQELEELRKRRPLAEMAKELEESEDAEMTAEGEPPKLAIDTSVPEGQQPAVPVSPMSPVHKQILKDDDADVPHLLRVLTEIHTRFYHSYDRDQTSKGKERAGKGPVTKADVREIIPSIKQSVFGDLSQGPPVDVVFSSVIPLGTDPTTWGQHGSFRDPLF